VPRRAPYYLLALQQIGPEFGPQLNVIRQKAGHGPDDLDCQPLGGVNDRPALDGHPFFVRGNLRIRATRRTGI
jgi:hypothetical protein